MRSNALILCLSLFAWTAVPARGAFLAETAFSYGTRSTLNTPPANYPNPSLDLTSLSAGSDSRASGGTGDASVKYLLPTSGTITAATLTFNVFSDQVSFTTITSITAMLTGYTATTSALSLNDFTLPTTSLGSKTLPLNIGNPFPPTNPSNVTLSFDVTSYLQTLALAGTSAVGFTLDASAYTNFQMSTPTDATTSFRPTLSITYSAAVPEPASVILLGMGGVVPLIMTWRRRR